MARLLKHLKHDDFRSVKSLKANPNPNLWLLICDDGDKRFPCYMQDNLKTKMLIMSCQV